MMCRTETKKSLYFFLLLYFKMLNCLFISISHTAKCDLVLLLYFRVSCNVNDLYTRNNVQYRPMVFGCCLFRLMIPVINE